MYSASAYSAQMQLFLMNLSCLIDLIKMYLYANLIMRLYGGAASPPRKALFALLAGPGLQSALVYSIYVCLGSVPFTKLQSLLITSPSPLTALAYCFLGIKILHLSRLRAVAVLGHVYLYSAIVDSLNRLAGSALFPQTGPRYNYLIAASHQEFSLLVSSVMFFIIWKLLDRWPNLIPAKPALAARPKRDLSVFLFKASVVYGCMVILPMALPEAVTADALVFVFLSLFFIYSLMYPI